MFENSQHRENPTSKSESLHDMKIRLRELQQAEETARRSSDLVEANEMLSEIEGLERQIEARSKRIITTRYNESETKKTTLSPEARQKRAAAELDKIRKTLS